MTSSNEVSSEGTWRPSEPEQLGVTAEPMDMITLHVLSPSTTEVPGGRITFASISLNTKVSDLKCRIQNSIPTTRPPPERQRLIYHGRPLLNMDATLRQVLQSELGASTHHDTIYTIHMVVTAAPGPARNESPHRPQGQVPQNASAQESTTRSSPSPQPANNHHTNIPWPPHPMMAQVQAAQSVLQNQLIQLQQQMSATNVVGQGHRPLAPGQAQGHGFNQLPHLPPSFPTLPPMMQAFPAAQQQHQMRTDPSVNGVYNYGANGVLPGTTFSQIPQGFGPLTTRVHETVGPDGQRTRVVVNETTFQMSRQPTPVPQANIAEAQRSTEAARIASNNPHASSGAGSGLPPVGSGLPRPRDLPQLSSLPPWVAAPQISSSPTSGHVPPEAASQPILPAQNNGSAPPPSSSSNSNYVPPAPAWPPTVLPHNREWASISSTSSTASTAFIVSGPNGPQALVFAPGHGLFANATSNIHPSSRSLGPNPTSGFQQTSGGPRTASHQAIASTASAVDTHPAVATAQRQHLQAVMVQARNAAAAARHDHANANLNANNELLRTVVSRVWTFIKLYVVIFMFTQPGTWFRRISLLAAVFVSIFPSITRFQNVAARVQARFDELLAPVHPPPQPVRRRAAEAARAPNDGEAAIRNDPSRTNRPPEPDPASTAARLVQEQRRHGNGLREGFERVERAVGLFLASLIPGVGERHVRVREEAREEARRERERGLADLNRSAAGEEESPSVEARRRESGEPKHNESEHQVSDGAKSSSSKDKEAKHNTDVGEVVGGEGRNEG